MTADKVIEQIVQIESSAKELTSKFQSRLDIIQQDLSSLIDGLKNLSEDLVENTNLSNDLTKKIDSLTKELEGLNNEISKIDGELARVENENKTISDNINQASTELKADEDALAAIETERSTYQEGLDNLKKDLEKVSTSKNDLQNDFDNKIKRIEEDMKRLTNERDLLDYQFKAIRILCSRDYLESPEVKMLKFFAMKPSKKTKIDEIHSSLGWDLGALKSLLNKLSMRNIIEYDSQREEIELLVDIDIFKKEDK